MPSGAFHTGRPNWFPNLSNGRDYPADGNLLSIADRQTPCAASSRKVVPVAYLIPVLEADQYGERDQQLLARRLRQSREFRPIHQLDSLDIGEAHHNNARPKFDQLIQARYNAPQQAPLLAGRRAGLNIGLKANRPVSIKLRATASGWPWAMA